MQQIQNSGIEGLSLRDLARELGVSHGAPYRHFADKKALLAGIALQGYQLLHAHIERAVAEGTNDPIEQLSRMARAYIDFATAHPIHLSLMYGPELATSTELESDDIYQTLDEASTLTLQMVRNVISDGKAKGLLSSEDVMIQATAAWSMVHGLAMLMGTGCVEGDDFAAYDRESLIQRTINTLFEGLRYRPTNR